MANKKTLQEYIIKIDADVKDAQEKVSKFENQFNDVLKDKSNAKIFQDEISQMKSSIESLSKECEKSFKIIKDSMVDSNLTKGLKDQLESIGKLIETELSDKLTQRLGLLENALNPNKELGLEKVIVRLTEPMVNLTNSIEKVILQLGKLNGDIITKQMESASETTKKVESDVKKAIRGIEEALIQKTKDANGKETVLSSIIGDMDKIRNFKDNGGLKYLTQLEQQISILLDTAKELDEVNLNKLLDQKGIQISAANLKKTKDFINIMTSEGKVSKDRRSDYNKKQSTSVNKTVTVKYELSKKSTDDDIQKIAEEITQSIIPKIQGKIDKTNAVNVKISAEKEKVVTNIRRIVADAIKEINDDPTKPKVLLEFDMETIKSKIQEIVDEIEDKLSDKGLDLKLNKGSAVNIENIEGLAQDRTLQEIKEILYNGIKVNREQVTRNLNSNSTQDFQTNAPKTFNDYTKGMRKGFLQDDLKGIAARTAENLKNSNNLENGINGLGKIVTNLKSTSVTLEKGLEKLKDNEYYTRGTVVEGEDGTQTYSTYKAYEQKSVLLEDHQAQLIEDYTETKKRVDEARKAVKAEYAAIRNGKLIASKEYKKQYFDSEEEAQKAIDNIFQHLSDAEKELFLKENHVDENGNVKPVKISMEVVNGKHVKLDNPKYTTSLPQMIPQWKQAVAEIIEKQYADETWFTNDGSIKSNKFKSSEFTNIIKDAKSYYLNILENQLEELIPKENELKGKLPELEEPIKNLKSQILSIDKEISELKKTDYNKEDLKEKLNLKSGYEEQLGKLSTQKDYILTQISDLAISDIEKTINNLKGSDNNSTAIREALSKYIGYKKESELDTLFSDDTTSITKEYSKMLTQAQSKAVEEAVKQEISVFVDIQKSFEKQINNIKKEYLEKENSVIGKTFEEEYHRSSAKGTSIFANVTPQEMFEKYVRDSVGGLNIEALPDIVKDLINKNFQKNEKISLDGEEVLIPSVSGINDVREAIYKIVELTNLSYKQNYESLSEQEDKFNEQKNTIEQIIELRNKMNSEDLSSEEKENLEYLENQASVYDIIIKDQEELNKLREQKDKIKSQIDDWSSQDYSNYNSKEQARKEAVRAANLQKLYETRSELNEKFENLGRKSLEEIIDKDGFYKILDNINGKLEEINKNKRELTSVANNTANQILRTAISSITDKDSYESVLKEYEEISTRVNSLRNRITTQEVNGKTVNNYSALLPGEKKEYFNLLPQLNKLKIALNLFQQQQKNIEDVSKGVSSSLDKEAQELRLVGKYAGIYNVEGANLRNQLLSDTSKQTNALDLKQQFEAEKKNVENYEQYASEYVDYSKNVLQLEHSLENYKNQRLQNNNIITESEVNDLKNQITLVEEEIRHSEERIAELDITNKQLSSNIPNKMLDIKQYSRNNQAKKYIRKLSQSGQFVEKYDSNGNITSESAKEILELWNAHVQEIIDKNNNLILKNSLAIQVAEKEKLEKNSQLSELKKQVNGYQSFNANSLSNEAKEFLNNLISNNVLKVDSNGNLYKDQVDKFIELWNNFVDEQVKTIEDNLNNYNTLINEILNKVPNISELVSLEQQTKSITSSPNAFSNLSKQELEEQKTGWTRILSQINTFGVKATDKDVYVKNEINKIAKDYRKQLDDILVQITREMNKEQPNKRVAKNLQRTADNLVSNLYYLDRSKLKETEIARFEENKSEKTYRLQLSQDTSPQELTIGKLNEKKNELLKENDQLLNLIQDSSKELILNYQNEISNHEKDIKILLKQQRNYNEQMEKLKLLGLSNTSDFAEYKNKYDKNDKAISDKKIIIEDLQGELIKKLETTSIGKDYLNNFQDINDISKQIEKAENEELKNTQVLENLQQLLAQKFQDRIDLAVREKQIAERNLLLIEQALTTAENDTTPATATPTVIKTNKNKEDIVFASDVEKLSSSKAYREKIAETSQLHNKLYNLIFNDISDFMHSTDAYIDEHFKDRRDVNSYQELENNISELKTIIFSNVNSFVNSENEEVQKYLKKRFNVNKYLKENGIKFNSSGEIYSRQQKKANQLLENNTELNKVLSNWNKKIEKEVSGFEKELNSDKFANIFEEWNEKTRKELNETSNILMQLRSDYQDFLTSSGTILDLISKAETQNWSKQTEYRTPSQQIADQNELARKKANAYKYAGLNNQEQKDVQTYNRLNAELSKNGELKKEQLDLYNKLSEKIKSYNNVLIDEKTKYASSTVDKDEFINNLGKYATNDYIAKLFNLGDVGKIDDGVLAREKTLQQILYILSKGQKGTDYPKIKEYQKKNYENSRYSGWKRENYEKVAKELGFWKENGRMSPSEKSKVIKEMVKQGLLIDNKSTIKPGTQKNNKSSATTDKNKDNLIYSKKPQRQDWKEKIINGDLNAAKEAIEHNARIWKNNKTQELFLTGKDGKPSNAVELTQEFAKKLGISDDALGKFTRSISHASETVEEEVKETSNIDNLSDEERLNRLDEKSKRILGMLEQISNNPNIDQEMVKSLREQLQNNSDEIDDLLKTITKESDDANDKKSSKLDKLKNFKDNLVSHFKKKNKSEENVIEEVDAENKLAAAVETTTKAELKKGEAEKINSEYTKEQLEYAKELGMLNSKGTVDGRKRSTFEKAWNEKIGVSDIIDVPKVEKEFQEDNEKIGETGGKAVEKGFRKSTQVNSPSPLFTEIGKWIGKSVNMGMHQGLDDGLKSTQEFVDKVVEILKSNKISSDQISGLFNSGVFKKSSVEGRILKNIISNNLLPNEYGEDNPYIGKSTEDLSSALKKEENALKRCKEGGDAYNKHLKEQQLITEALTKANNELSESQEKVNNTKENKTKNARADFANNFDVENASKQQLLGAKRRFEKSKEIGNTEEILAWENKIADIESKLANIDKQHAANINALKEKLHGTDEVYSSVEEKIERAKELAKSLNLEISDINDISLKMSDKSNTWVIDDGENKYTIVEKINEANESIDVQVIKIQELDNAYTQLKKTLKNSEIAVKKFAAVDDYLPNLFGGFAPQVERAKTLYKELKEITANNGKGYTTEKIAEKISELETIMRAINGKNGIEGQIAKLTNPQVASSELLKKNLKSLMVQYAAGEIQTYKFAKGNQQLTYSVRTADDQLKTYAMTIDTAGNVTQKLVSETKYIGTLGKLFGSFKQKFGELLRYTTASLSFWRVINMIKSGVNIVKELDTAMTEMRKVSNDSEQALQSFAKASHNVAQSIGSTAAIIQNSAADWMRLGYNIEEAAELSKNTAILMNVSEFDSINSATDSMVAMVQAFKDANKDVGQLSEEIIDKLNNIGNNFSISTSDLAESLKRSSGTLISAGNTIDEAIALTTAANAITQDPESTGSALKVISMRIRGTKAEELEEEGEDTEGLIETTSKLQEKIKSLTAINGKLGVSILDNNGNYRTTYEILQDIADLWEEIGEADKKDGQNRQPALLEALAGKTRAQSLASLLQNPEMLRKVYESSKESQGSAQRENEEYMKSIEAHIQVLQAKWQEFWNSTINRDQINFVLDSAGKLLDIANKIGTLPAAGGILGLFLGAKQFAKGAQKQDSVISNIVSLFKSKKLNLPNTEEVSKHLVLGKDNILEFKETTEETTDSIKKFSKEGKNNIPIIGQISAGFTKLVAVVGSTGAAIAVVAGVLAAVAAVGVAIWYKWYHSAEQVTKRSKEAIEKSKELADALKKESDEAKELVNNYSDLISQYEKATKGSEEYYDIANKIAELDPNSVLGYNNNGDAILKENEELKNNLELHREIAKAKLEEAKIGAEETVNTASQEYNSNIKKKKEIDQQIIDKRREIEKLEKSIEDQYNTAGHKTTKIVDDETTLAIYKKDLEKLLKDSQLYGEAISNALNELNSNYVYLLPDFDESLSDAEQEYEKDFRNFVLEIAKDSKINSSDFEELYASARRVNSEFYKELFDFKDNDGISYEDFKAKAEEIYQKIITALQAAGFELNEQQKLSLKVYIESEFKDKVDNAKTAIINNALKGSSLNSDVNRASMSHWVDQLPEDDLEVVSGQDFGDTFKKIQKDNPGKSFVQWLNMALEDVKETQKVMEEIADFNENHLRKTNDSLKNVNSLYQNLMTNINDKKSGYDLAFDIDEIENLRSYKNDDNEEVELKLDETKFNAYKKILTEGTASANEMKDALNGLSTLIADTILEQEDFSEESQQLAKAQLYEAGITKKSADAYVDYRTSLNKLKNEFSQQYKDNILSQEMQELGEGGSVDLTLRPVIDTSELEKVGWKNTGGGIATLFTSTYSNEDNTIAMNFTPIMTDESGNYLGTLSPEELQQYAEDVMNGVREDDLHLKIGATFEGKDAIEKAETQAQYIHELQEQFYDDNGNISLEIFGNVEALDAYAQQLGVTSQALAAYVFQETLCSGQNIETAQDCQNLLSLAKQAGATGKVIEYLTELMSIYSQMETALANGQYPVVAALQSRANQLNALIQSASTMENLELETPTIENRDAVKAAGGAGKEAADAYKEAFEKELKELDELRDAGVISEREYLERLKALYIKYFKDRKEYLKEFKQYEKQYLEGMKSLYESAISGAITILNDQINDLEKAKDEAVEALEKARDAEIKPLEEKVKALEKERDEMQKVNEQRERELNLQKAKYDLERAMSQRNRLIYKNGQMQYVNDYAEVRDTKENLEDAIFDKKIGELDDQIDELNDQIDEINEKYDKLIEQTEKFYDEQIKGLQDMIDKWEEIQHVAEMAEAIQALSELGLTMDDVLSGNVDFEGIKTQYAAIIGGLNGIDSAAQAVGKSAGDLNTALESILGYNFDTLNADGLASSLDNTAKNATAAASAIGGGGGTTSTEDPGTKTNATGSGDASGTGNSASGGSGLIDSVDTLVSKKSEVEEFANTFAGGGDEKNESSLAAQIQTTSDKIGTEETEAGDGTLIGEIMDLEEVSREKVPEVNMLFLILFETLHACTTQITVFVDKLREMQALTTGEGGFFGSAGFSGTAYAHGKWNAGSKGLDGVSLTGELGQELVVHKDGTFETVGDNGAEFANIKSSDIVFNHKQTEELLKNGKINSRGKAYASGKDNIFSPLSPTELSKYDLNLTKDLTEKLEFGNQKLTSIDKAIGTITNSNTVNNSGQTFNISNEFTCNGISLAEVQQELAKAFEGIFVSAYQRAMK